MQGKLSVATRPLSQVSASLIAHIGINHCWQRSAMSLTHMQWDGTIVVNPCMWIVG